MGVGLIDREPIVDHGVDERMDLDPELIEFTPIGGNETIGDVHMCPDLTIEQINDINSLLQKYETTLTDVPGRSRVGQHDIRLTCVDPIMSKPYNTPFSARETIIKEVKEMVDLGIIERSDSPYASPIVLVRKQDGKVRFCIDFRKLNRITIFDAEPMANPEELFSRLNQGRYLTKLDLTKGFWQIPLADGAKAKTAFLTPLGLFQYRFMPFGLVNSPATFNRTMRIVLRDIGENVVNLVDDILIFNEKWGDHLKTVENVLHKLKQAGLTAKPSKCYFGFPQLEFLGHVVGRGELRTMAAKVECLKNTCIPKTKTQVRSMLGLASYYRRFIPNFAAIAAPLHDLTKKGQPTKVIWGEIHQQAFNQLKDALCQQPILKLPDFDKTFVIRTDASDRGLGAVLIQYYDDVAFPVAYASRKVSPAESNYSVIEKECLAVVWGLRKFQQYLLLKEFWIETDHQPLVYLNKAKMNNGRLMRWALYLQSFSYRIIAIKGSHNLGADYLSRQL